MSKSFGMAGWRLGFVVGNAELVARMTTLQDHVRAGIFTPIQRAGIAALTGPQETVTERVQLYERRRDRVLDRGGSRRAVRGHVLRLDSPARRPDAGARLLEEQRLVVAPGEGFGPAGPGWARLAATPDEVIDLGLERLAAALPEQPSSRRCTPRADFGAWWHGLRRGPMARLRRLRVARLLRYSTGMRKPSSIIGGAPCREGSFAELSSGHLHASSSRRKSWTSSPTGRRPSASRSISSVAGSIGDREAEPVSEAEHGPID